MTSALPLALSDALRDWLDLGLRWLHVIAAMAWIGTSFYFVLLDQSLRPAKDPADRDAGVGGELWEVHGGGFYHVQKYVVAPPRLPDHLAWFKWEAYTTWLSGFGLMIVLYYLEASSTLVKPGSDLDPWVAVAISIAPPRDRVDRVRRAEPSRHGSRASSGPCSSCWSRSRRGAPRSCSARGRRGSRSAR